TSTGAAQESLLPPPGAPARSVAEPRGPVAAPPTGLRGRGAPPADSAGRGSGAAPADPVTRAGGAPSVAADAPPFAGDPQRAEATPRLPGRPPMSSPGEADVSPDLATAWQRVIDEVMKRKPTLGAVLMHARPGVIDGGELSIVVTGNHFHRDT